MRKSNRSIDLPTSDIWDIRSIQTELNDSIAILSKKVKNGVLSFDDVKSGKGAFSLYCLELKKITSHSLENLLQDIANKDYFKVFFTFSKIFYSIQQHIMIFAHACGEHKLGQDEVQTAITLILHKPILKKQLPEILTTLSFIETSLLQSPFNKKGTFGVIHAQLYSLFKSCYASQLTVEPSIEIKINTTLTAEFETENAKLKSNGDSNLKTRIENYELAQQQLSSETWLKYWADLTAFFLSNKPDVLKMIDSPEQKGLENHDIYNVAKNFLSGFIFENTQKTEKYTLAQIKSNVKTLQEQLTKQQLQPQSFNVYLILDNIQFIKNNIPTLIQHLKNAKVSNEDIHYFLGILAIELEMDKTELKKLMPIDTQINLTRIIPQKTPIANNKNTSVLPAQQKGSALLHKEASRGTPNINELARSCSMHLKNLQKQLHKQPFALKLEIGITLNNLNKDKNLHSNKFGLDQISTELTNFKEGKRNLLELNDWLNKKIETLDTNFKNTNQFEQANCN